MKIDDILSLLVSHEAERLVKNKEEEKIQKYIRIGQHKIQNDDSLTEKNMLLVIGCESLFEMGIITPPVYQLFGDMVDLVPCPKINPEKLQEYVNANPDLDKKIRAAEAEHLKAISDTQRENNYNLQYFG